MFKESYDFHLGELLSYYQDIWNGEEKLDKDFINEFDLSLLKLDTMLTRMKYLQEMPELDSTLLNFEILKDSFLNAKSGDYFRPEDYEIHFLVYSLLEHDDISKQSLVQIINGFFKHRKIRIHLKYRDIERTETGSVRCKTNLRFALFYLREYGLINYFEKGRRAWSLTLPGFLIAAFLCLDKKNFAPAAYEFNLIRLFPPDRNPFSRMDLRIVEVINELSINKNLDRVFAFVDYLSNDNDLKQISYDIFLAYRNFIERFKHNKETHAAQNRKFVNTMNEFILRQNRNSNVEFFKSRFSDLINADRFFNELIKNTNVKEN